MKPYLDLLRLVLESGEKRTDRTGVGTLSIFGAQARYDLRNGFPLVTTKKVLFPMVVRELLWFLSGSTNVNDLVGAEQLWKPWAFPNGSIGPSYGEQWRHWGCVWGGYGGTERDENALGIDQISQVLESIKTNPSSRRHIVSAWNVEAIPEMALPPCHMAFQFHVAGEYNYTPNGQPSYKYLDCQLYQRSADLALGVPFNIASYALLLSMVAMECKLTPRYFIHTLGDAHIYLNHVDGIRKQVDREPLPLPRLVLADKPVLEQRFEDIAIEDYQHHPFIKFEVAV